MGMYYSASMEQPFISKMDNDRDNVSIMSSVPLAAANATITSSVISTTSDTKNSTKVTPSSRSYSVLRDPQTLSRVSGDVPFLDYLFVDDKLVGATLAKMSDMLDSYFGDK